MNAPLPTQYLPDGLKRIADYCGWEVMWLIWEAAAGTRIQVSMAPAADHWLCELLGPVAARQFCDTFGGETLNIPKADAAKRAVRDRAIRHEKANGAGINALAVKYKLTYRQIQTICREVATPAVNFDVFDF